MKEIALHAAALEELHEAAAHYEGRREGLGGEFREEFEIAAQRVQRNPNAFPVYKETGYRKCLLKRFPYTLYFQELEDCIWIAAVAHQKRRTDYWISRDPGE